MVTKSLSPPGISALPCATASLTPRLSTRIRVSCDGKDNLRRSARVQAAAAAQATRSAVDRLLADASWPTKRVQEDELVPTPLERLHSIPLELNIRQAVTLVVAAFLGFSLLACDVVSWHRLSSLDIGVHTWVLKTIPVHVRYWVAGNVLSNTPIVAGWCGWATAAIFAGQALVQGKSGRAVRHTAIAAIMYAFGGGNIRNGDPFLVDVLKHIVVRLRPSPVHATYAFPSGHTTTATFLIGALLFVIIPAVVTATAAQEGERSGTARVLAAVSQKIASSRVLTWILLAGTTASGRVLADAHWTTDVLAGGCLGAALVGVAIALCSVSDALFIGIENIKSGIEDSKSGKDS